MGVGGGCASHASRCGSSGRRWAPTSFWCRIREALVLHLSAAVGPYTAYGTPLVEACAVAGTSYCDITGEVQWVRRVIDRCDNVARASGARIVPFCGHDCVPWDLLALALANRLKEQHGEQLQSLSFYDDVSGIALGVR